LSVIWLVLPAYNEERSLPSLLERCVPLAREWEGSGLSLRVLVIDDGSRDGTIAAARSFADRLAIEVIPHGVNRGLGAALRTGLAAGLERAGEADGIATMDADNTHDPSILPRMWERLAAGSDVVIASRYEPGGEEIGLSPMRRVLSRGASFLLSVVVPVRGARDYTCGYRLYRSSTLHRAAEVWMERLIEEGGFTCMAEVLLKLGRSGARVSEVPLVLRYDLKQGGSKMKVMRTIGRYFVLSSRIRRHRVPRISG
jgi:dolichol-phosphate mannosyltransferase